ncbi:hypothetical protein [sulfur-oxidizing endosymbiont of Gigantopelta aegis]|nr:hypothetical protein [sulfur-oxidizing endosymbiont of Gigantopelta aegis]
MHDGLADLYTDNLSIIVGNVVQQWDYGDNTPLTLQLSIYVPLF